MKKLDLEQIRNLPETLTPAEIAPYLQTLLSSARDDCSRDVDYLMEVLSELADRQWHTYQRLDADLRDRLDQWICAHWDLNSDKVTQHALSIIPKLGLVKSVDYAKKALASALTPNIRTEIESAVKEYGDSIDDPYSGMKK